jgi:hypothetical protein
MKYTQRELFFYRLVTSLFVLAIASPRISITTYTLRQSRQLMLAGDVQPQVFLPPKPVPMLSQNLLFISDP